MNLDELERLYRKATPGEWLLSDVDIPPIVYLGAQKNEAMIACVDAGAGYANLPVNEAEANAKSIAALHNAFPDLLALARDGERYRWLRDETNPDKERPYVTVQTENDWGNWFNTFEQGPSLDAAIDAARKGEKP
ncbi:MAG: hypothetical protein WC100_05665 [Sterolibacterium sp.]